MTGERAGTADRGAAPGREGPAEGSGGAGRAGLALATAAVAQFLVSLDLSVVNVGLPEIGAALGFGEVGLTWVIHAYALTFGGLLLLGGKAADRYGQKRMLLVGLGLFGAASLLGGFATEPGHLVAARAAQGVGAAALAPAGLALLTATFPGGRARVRAFGIWSAMNAAGGALGVLIGGVLTEYAGWRWVMFVNVPMALVALAMTWRGVATDGPRGLVVGGGGGGGGVERGRERGRPDVLGGVLATGGMSLLVFGIVRTDRHAWTSAVTVTTLAVALALLTAFVVVERTTGRDPLVRLGLLANRAVLGAITYTLVIGAAMASSFYFMSLYLQRVLGNGPAETGLQFLPFALGVVAGSVLAVKLGYRYAPRLLLAGGGLLTAAGFAWFGLMDADGTYAVDVLGPSILASVGFGLVLGPLVSVATGGVAAHEAGMASGLLNSARQLGAALGLAALGTAAHHRTGESPGAADLNDGYALGLTLCAALLVVAVLIATTVLPRRAEEDPPRPDAADGTRPEADAVRAEAAPVPPDAEAPSADAGAVPAPPHAAGTQADPARTPPTSPHADAHPAAERPGPAPPAPSRTVTGLLRPHLRGFAAVVLLQVVGALAGLVPLLAVVELGRTLLAPGPVERDRVWAVVAVGAAGLAVRLLFTAASSGVGHLLDGRVQLAFRRRLAARLGRVPLGWFSRRRTGELAKVVGEDVAAMHPLIAHAPSELISAFVVPAASLAYLFTVDWRLTLITLIPVAVALAHVPLFMAPARVRDQEEFDAAMGRISSASVEFAQGIAEVKAFGGGERAHRAFRTAADDFADTFKRMVHGLSPIGAGMQVALSPPFVLLVVLVGGTSMITAGALAPADLLPFLLLGLGLTAPVAALGHGFDDLQGARRAVGRIRDVLDVDPLPQPARPRTPRGHRVELRGVRFGYDAEREVLRGIDLVLEPGTVTAVVGPSGSGKSTLVQLLPRFFDPDRGAALLGGVDLRDMAGPDLCRAVSFVFQDVRLLRASVADNIALAVPEAGREDVIRAARRAHIHDRILELPRDYHTVIGEEAELSGGEAQRLSLARALLAAAPVLVLDEATSFADPQTELAVRRTLAAPAGGDRTTLIIAHRLETVAEADTVVMLADGVIAEQGSPAELLARGGRFADFWHAHRSATAHDSGRPPAAATEATGPGTSRPPATHHPPHPPPPPGRTS
ncbi:MFS transporter [Streptomyces sp. WAC 06738]|uniref:MFS transporter n=1 Tax=Streptomyces sp. WAC 06738 TaxID=2203210 RepID=UPI001F0C2DCB|nr:MFS transporter [Streptomyces sp. WAC 06738]